MSNVRVFGNPQDAYSYIIRNCCSSYKIVDECANPYEIKKVIFNDPATIVMWEDGTKTVVKCQDGDIYDKRTGLLLCMAKKMYGNKNKFNDILNKWCPEEDWECPPDWEWTFVGAWDAICNSILGGKA